eukprot:1355225-Amorphochlora_amoeboformis.AAC.1
MPFSSVRVRLAGSLEQFLFVPPDIVSSANKGISEYLLRPIISIPFESHKNSGIPVFTTTSPDNQNGNASPSCPCPPFVCQHP